VELIRTKKFLFGIVVVLLLVTSVLPGCNEEQQLVIPSSLEPFQILWEVCNTTPPLELFPGLVGEWSREDMNPELTELIPNNASEEGFINGVFGIWPERFYTMRGGQVVLGKDGQIVISLIVLKYENAEFAEKSFVNISTADGLRDSIYEGIALGIGFHSLAPWEAIWRVTKVPCCLIQSDCFVIYIYGREDVLNDMLDRIIVAFGNDSANATLTMAMTTPPLPKISQ